jgi:REP element-mobilizing transposase RayT
MAFVIRKDIRLPGNNYIGRQIYFVTVCCEGRVPFFSPPDHCKIAIEALKRVSDSMHFLIHAYCIMPDHTYILAEGSTPDANLGPMETVNRLFTSGGKRDTYLAAAFLRLRVTKGN